MTRYHGLLAPNAKHRAELLKLVPGVQIAAAAAAKAADPLPNGQAQGVVQNESAQDEATPTSRHRHLWADLHRRVFAHDLLLCPCGARRKVIGLLSRSQSPEALAAFLTAIGEPTEPPITAPARAPPQRDLGFGDESINSDSF